MARLRPGDLRQRVTWNKRTGVGDGYNSTAPVYSTVGTYWAKVTPLAVNEEVVGDAMRATVTHSVLMRWVGTISEADQLVYLRATPDGATSNVTLEVVQVLDEDELHFQVTLLCKETRE